MGAAGSVVGVDISKPMLEVALRRLRLGVDQGFWNRLKARTTPGGLELDETIVLCSASSAISLQSFAR